MPEQVEFPMLTIVTPYPRKSNLLSEHSATWRHIHNWRVFSLIACTGDIVNSLGVWCDWDAIHVELYSHSSHAVIDSISVSRNSIPATNMSCPATNMSCDNDLGMSGAEPLSTLWEKALSERLTDMLARSGLKLSTSLV